MKKTCRAILSWGLALAAALVCANLVSYFYRSGAGSIPREHAFSTSIRTPNSRLVRGSEGYGINYADENGYLNLSDQPLSKNYILLMGSSHAEGLQVMQKYNMATVLNHMLGGDTRTVYNLGTAGYTLPLIVKGFQAALEEFPDSSAILIEISQLSIPVSEFKDAMDQTQFDPDSTGQALIKSQNTARHLRNAILEAAPIISLLRAQVESVHFGFEGAFGIDSELLAPIATKAEAAKGGDAAQQTTQSTAGGTAAGDSAQGESYSDVLHQVFALLRAEYDKPIILLYHPALQIQRDGTMKLRREEGHYDEYSAACKDNGIVFVDTGEAFLKAYKEDFIVPYGFSNTTLGGGHLNAAGHKIVAEEFYQALMEIQGKGND